MSELGICASSHANINYARIHPPLPPSPPHFCSRGLNWLTETHFNDEPGQKVCGFITDTFSFTSLIPSSGTFPFRTCNLSRFLLGLQLKSLDFLTAVIFWSSGDSQLQTLILCATVQGLHLHLFFKLACSASLCCSRRIPFTTCVVAVLLPTRVCYPLGERLWFPTCHFISFSLFFFSLFFFPLYEMEWPQKVGWGFPPVLSSVAPPAGRTPGL